MSTLLPVAEAVPIAAVVPPLADHSMGAAAIGFAGPPLLVFAGLAALVLRERRSRGSRD